MTEIEVPDWVVEIAAKAVYETFPDSTWERLKEVYRDIHREEARLAITAALGAWVVPVGRLNDSSPTLYTLRQEKPE